MGLNYTVTFKQTFSLLKQTVISVKITLLLKTKKFQSNYNFPVIIKSLSSSFTNISQCFSVCTWF